MTWLQGPPTGERGLVCPACQIPRGYDDGVEGTYLQPWDSGFAGGFLRLQTYDPCKEETIETTGIAQRPFQATEIKRNSHADKAVNVTHTPTSSKRKIPNKDAEDQEIGRKKFKFRLTRG